MNKFMRITAALLIACSCMTATAQFSNLQQTESVRIESGKSGIYEYDPARTKLRYKDSIEATLYIATGNEVYAVDLNPVSNGKTWKVDFVVPDSALAIAFRFGSAEITDDNYANGYIYPLYKRNRPVAGARAACADMLMKCKRQLGLGPDHAKKALVLYQEEFRKYPGLKAGKELELHTAIAWSQKETGYPVIEKKAHSLLQQSFTEKNWKLAAELFKLTGKKALADSLKEDMARRLHVKIKDDPQYWERFLSIRNPDSMMAFLAGIPAHELEEKDRIQMRNMAIGEYAQQGKSEQAFKYLPLITVPQVKADMLYRMAKSFLKNGSRLSEADSLMKLVVATPRMEFKDRSLTSPAEWNFRYDQTLSEYYHTYAQVKMQQGKPDEALGLLRSAIQYSRGTDHTINEAFIGSLAAAGLKRELVQYASAWIADGGGSPAITNELRKAYGDGFDTYLDSLQMVSKRKMQWQLEFTMIEKEMPPFSLMKLDSSGIISSDALKGKVVVLDFWATWCEPCKRSFPAMQNAVHHYKNDTGVVFLFVDTWESMAPSVRVSQIRKFMEKNGYDFQVLLDEPANQQRKIYKLAAALGMQAIPTKIVIDRKGKIRFLSTGSLSDAAKLLTELSNMIEIAGKQ